MSNRILHLATDEKFIDSANWQFEKVNPGGNDFFIFLSNGNEKLKYVTEKRNIQKVYTDDLNFESLLKKINEYNLVVLHGLDYLKSKIVLESVDTRFLWIFWGGEVHDHPKYTLTYIGNTTKRYFRAHFIGERLKNAFRPFVYRLKHNKKDPFKVLLKAARKIQFFGVFYEEEYDFLLREQILSYKCSLIKISYYPLEFVFNQSEDLLVNGNDILIGNSASITNNHLEAFHILSKLNTKDQKFVVPLSYGDENYSHEVIKEGKRMFGLHFKPITDFVPLKEYNLLLQSCNVVIMNHYRQQAVGTVLSMIWMGAKVYLSNRSTLYHYLIRIKVKIFCIEKDLTQKNETAFLPLNNDQICLNRKILKDEIGVDHLIKTLRVDLEKMINVI